MYIDRFTFTLIVKQSTAVIMSQEDLTEATERLALAPAQEQPQQEFWRQMLQQQQQTNTLLLRMQQEDQQLRRELQEQRLAQQQQQQQFQQQLQQQLLQQPRQQQQMFRDYRRWAAPRARNRGFPYRRAGGRQYGRGGSGGTNYHIHFNS